MRLYLQGTIAAAVLGLALALSGCGGSPALPASAATPPSTPGAAANSGASAAGSAAAPAAPASAKVYSGIEKNGSLDTGSCGAISCAGGSAVPISQAVSRVLQPALDGGSSQFRVTGKSGADALWWYKLGPDNNVKNLQFDFWLSASPQTAQFAQALEFDTFQFANPTRFMFGTECNYGGGYNAGTWDVWDEKGQQWHHTSVPCPGFVPGDWYHVTWTFHRSDDKYEHYDNVAIEHYDASGKKQLDSSSTPVNIALDSGPLPGDWMDTLGVQFQLDVNGSAGASATYTTFVDKVSLSVW